MSNNSKVIQVIARALILDQNQVLLAHGKKYEHVFLPGGHVEFGENTEKSLQRELLEEIGLKIEIEKFLGVIEHSFGKNKDYQHEINLIFLAKIGKKKKIDSREKELEFFWASIDDLNKLRLEPRPLKKIIPQIINYSNEITWSSTI